MDKTQKDLDLYFLTRNVTWRYRLDQYEDATIAEMLKTVRSTVAEIKREIFDGDVPDNADALIAELEALSAGLRKRIGEDVATMSSVAGEYSVAEHTAIMSLDGAVKINTVALSAAQFKEFLGGPTQGTPLPAWVDAAWGEAVSDKIRRNLNVAVLRGEGYQKAVRGLLDAGLADFSEREAITIARTYVQTANVAAQMAVYQENDDLVKGWRWSAVLEPGYSKSGRGTCLRCQSLDQREFKMGEGPPIPLHPRCRCVAIPVTKTWRELGIDRDEIEAAIRPYTIRPDQNIDAGGMRTIIESGRHQGDYASWWAKQPEAFKINAVGPGRYELLKSGKISFADLVDGDGRQRTLKELMGGIPSPPARSGFLSGAEKYIPFDDKVKALEWARQKYVDDFTLEKLPVSAINEINDAANNSLVRFGVRLSKIDNAGGQNLGICRYSLGKSVSVGLQQNLVKNPDKVIPKLTDTFERIKAEQLRQARLGLEQSPKGSKISEAISAKIEKWENSKRYSVVYDSARPAYSAASHEFAHAVAFKNPDAAIFFTKELTSAGISYNEKLAISQYGAGNPSELFAESFALLVDGRAKEIPESIYKILEKTIEMMEKK